MVRTHPIRTCEKAPGHMDHLVVSPASPGVIALPGETDAVSRLVARVRQMAVRAGQTVTAAPDVWLFRADAPMAYVRNYSPMMNIAVAVSGRKTVRIGDHLCVNDPRHYLVMQGSKHYVAQVEASLANPYIALKLQLPPDIVGRALLDLLDLDALPASSPAPPPAFVGPLEEGLAEPLYRLLSCLDDPLERHVLVPLCLREITFRLLRSDAASLLRASVTREHARVLKAIRFIEENAQATISVQAMAQSVAMSPSHFAHRFREVVGVSPLHYLKMLRLEKARLALLAGSATVGAVAETTGYASTSHFSRDFRRQFGLSPAAYAQTFGPA